MGGFGTACQIGCYFHVAWQKVQSGRHASFFFSLFSLHLVDLLFLKALAIQESLLLSTTVVRPLVFVENQVSPKPIDCRHLWPISSRPRKNCGALFKGCPTLMFGVCLFFSQRTAILHAAKTYNGCFERVQYFFLPYLRLCRADF